MCCQVSSTLRYCPYALLLSSSKLHGQVRSSLHVSQRPIWSELFCGMKQLGIFVLPLSGMLVHPRVNPALSLSVLIYTPGWREAL